MAEWTPACPEDPQDVAKRAKEDEKRARRAAKSTRKAAAKTGKLTHAQTTRRGR